MHYKSVTEGN